jgi:hypothetical protein
MTRAVGRSVDGYVERHHILPRSMGGSDDPVNIVALTYREHFLAHWLLTKFTTGADRRKMLHALYRMGGQMAGRVIPSWRYTIAREAQRDAKLGTKQAPEVVAKRAAALIGNRNGAGVKLTPDQIEGRRRRLMGNKHSLGFCHSNETRAKRGAASKAVWARYTEEQKVARAAKVSAGAALTRAAKGPAPWVILGMSHRTWYRRGKPQPEAMGGDNR